MFLFILESFIMNFTYFFEVLNNFAWFNFPYFLTIFSDSSIRREFARSNSIKDWHFGPFLFIFVSLIDLNIKKYLLCFGIRRKT